MTNRKSVVEIDIQDSRWKSFIAEFAKFRTDNKKLVEETTEATAAEARLVSEKRKILEAQAKLAKMTKEERADAEAEAKAKAKIAEEDKKAYDTERRKFALQSQAKDDARKERAESMKGLRDSAKWTADIARNVAGAAFSAAKWVAFSAVASGFGLGGLAANASTMRRQSQGLGINTGELRAASVNFGKYIDPESTLGNIAGAQTDLSKRWIFKSLGENVEGKNAGDILPEILPKLVQAFRAGGSTLQGAQGRGLDQLVGIEDLRRLSSLTEKELSDTIDAYKRDRASLLEGDDTGRSWQEFLVSLHRVSQEIEVSLLKGLTKLTPYLTQFAEGIAKAIDSFVSNGGLQAWIEKVGAALQKLGAYLGSKDFADDVETFMGAIHTMATYLGKLFPKSQVAAETAQGTVSSMPAAGAPPATFMEKMRAAGRVYGAVWDHLRGNSPLAERNHNPGNLRIPGSTTGFQTFKSDDDGIKALAHQLQLYENRDGLHTIRGIISKYAPGNENNTAAYIANVSKRTGLGADQRIDPTNLDQLVKLIQSITKQENGRSNFTEGGIRVLIQNATGGSAQASVAALTGG